MSRRICRYCSALLISLLCCHSAAQTKGDDAKPKETFFQGVYVSADVFGYVMPIFTSDSYLSHEASVSVNLLNRFLPTVEAGYGSCNTTGQLYGIHYTTSAPYLRVGMDYNTQFRKGLTSYLLAGVRVGMSRFGYEVDGVGLNDPVWHTSTPLSIDVPSRNALWGEGVLGIRAQIAGPFYMGWTLRYRIPFRSTSGDNGNPWYIPGYGVYGDKNIGATYTLTWYFHTKPSARP